MVGKVFYLLLLSSFLQFLVIDAISYDEDTTITLDEADAIEKLRHLVRSKLPHKYMEASIFLVKWARAQDFDVIAAEEALLKHIDWRAKHKIDQIDDEDWEDCKTDSPWNLDGVDKTGKPLVQIDLKTWKSVTKATENGLRDRIARWLFKYMEDATKIIRKSQSEGKKVARFTFMLDVEGFNVADFGCPQCIQVYAMAAEALSQQYPGSVDEMIFTNSSDEFSKMLNTYIIPVVSKNMRKAIKIYGMDREVWRKELLKFIDEDQLLPAFGGTMRAE